MACPASLALLPSAGFGCPHAFLGETGDGGIYGYYLLISAFLQG